jgi:hypothetical protein
MKIYNYDRSSRVYLGESDAEPSPMEPGAHLTPAFATIIKPPETLGGEVAVFDVARNRWSVLAAPSPVAAVQPPAATFEEKVSAWRAAVRSYTNIIATAYDFDSIDEAVTYANEPAVPKFRMLGESLRAWRSMVWQAFDVMVAEIKGGILSDPVDQVELRSHLPGFVPPDTSQIGIERYVADADETAS